MVALLWLLALAGAAAVRGDVGHQEGIASWYGPGGGVATQWCSWTYRHEHGCGFLAIQSHQTGRTVVAPVIDWCQCYRGTSRERIVDLQLDVVAALGLKKSQGLYPVTTWPVDGAGGQVSLPNTALPEPQPAWDPWPLAMVVLGAAMVAADRLAWWLHRRRMARLARPYLVEEVIGFLTAPEEDVA